MSCVVIGIYLLATGFQLQILLSYHKYPTFVGTTFLLKV